MAETDSAPSTGPTPHQTTDDDLTPPPAGTTFEAAAPLKDMGVDFQPGDDAAGRSPIKAADAGRSIGDNVGSLQQQAADKVRLFAEDGKARVGGAIDQFAQMLLDAAAQVDDKLGAQYGDYARTAATTVQEFAEGVRDKDIDELADDVRGYIRKSPAAAVGVTAALGFALARMVHAGLDQRA